MKKTFFIVLFMVLMFCGCSVSYGDVQCYNCRKEINSDQAQSIDDEFFCDNCYKHAKKCYNCHRKYIENSETPYLNYCIDCIYDDKVLFHCVNCGIYYPVDQKYNFDGDPLCADCYFNTVFSSENFSDFSGTNQISKWVAQGEVKDYGYESKRYYQSVGDFFTRNGCIVISSDNKYHELYCTHISDDDSFMIMDISTAENLGYKRCVDCHN